MRKKIDVGLLRSQLQAPAGPYAQITVVPTTGSTNADLVAAAGEEAEDRTVLIAEEQTAGVGRRLRKWSSPNGAGVYLSVLLRPSQVPFANLSSLSAVAGLAVLDVARRLAVPAALKWPNDVLAGPDRKKCAGILAEAVASDERAVVLGIGLNVLNASEPIAPSPGGLPATSLQAEGARQVDRTEIAQDLLIALAEREARWRAADGDLAQAGLLAEYRDHCETLGQQVKIIFPDGKITQGIAEEIAPTGQLVMVQATGQRSTILAGDVVHLRTAAG